VHVDARLLGVTFLVLSNVLSVFRWWLQWSISQLLSCSLAGCLLSASALRLQLL
jgi:hypothetical protein